MATIGLGVLPGAAAANLLNNFCISVTGNEASCTRCHAGYGWADSSFDFTRVEDVDCLVCTRRSWAASPSPTGWGGPRESWWGCWC